MTNKESVSKYKKTKKGILTRIYLDQKKKSKQRSHQPPSYTKEQLGEWLFNHPKFNGLYDNWVESGYKTLKCPSVDRLSNDKGYSFDNIQLITWEENRNKEYGKRRSGRCKLSRTIYQYSLNGVFINKYTSLSNAGRMTGIDRSCIYYACEGKLKQSGGYKWSYNMTV